MLEFEFIYALFFLPLPWLVHYFVPAYKTKSVAYRVPFATAVATALNIPMSHGANELKKSRWQKASIAIGWLVLVLAAAKPIWLGEPTTHEKSGRDLMVLVDLSGSMSTQDFTDPSGRFESRLDSAKRVLQRFSESRAGDRLGLIVFGDAAYVQSPFTHDHKAWLSLLFESEVSMAGESTHLGDAIGLGIKHLSAEENDKNKEKVLILITDGNDTDSLVPPIDAATVAAYLDIRIHTIAMGDPHTVGESAIDLDTLHKISSLTGGVSLLAQSSQELKGAHDVVSSLEPSIYQSFTVQPKESLHHFLILVLVLHHILFMSVSLVISYRRQHACTPQGGR